MLLAAAPTVFGIAPSEPSPGQLWAFGNNNAAQLGNETNVETQEPNPPTPVALPEEAGLVVDAAAGGGHTLVITDSGDAYAFGYNYHGQLGNSTYIEGNGPHGWNPVPALIVLPGQVGPVVQVEGGGDFSFALTESGQLYAFGENTFGQLGNETNINQITGKANPTPTLVTLPGQNGPVVEVAAGVLHTLVLTESGQLYSFGGNYDGQLGRETTPAPGKWANPTPTLVTLPAQEGKVVQIAAGRNSSFAVTESGQLYAFGENRYGQLGFEENSGPGPDPSENDHQTPTLVALPGDEPVAEVAAGSFHTLVLTADGQLYAFGKNTFGELGSSTNNENQEANPTPTVVALPGSAGQIDEFTAGYEDSFVLTSTGRLYSFGWNWFAELGRTTNNKSLKPNPVPTVAPMPAGAALETVGTGSTASHTLVVVGMAMTTSSLPAGSEGSPYEAQLEVGGGEPPYEWSAKGLPAGLSVDEVTGEFSGTPTGITCNQVQCKYSATFTVTDSRGMEVSRVLALALAPEPSTPPDDGPPGGDPPPPDNPPPPPIEEGVPTQARLRIGRVHQTASKLRLVVPGTIVRQATGAVVIKGTVRIQGRRATTTSRAQILDGRWRVRLSLPWAKRRPDARVHLVAHFEGSSGVMGERAKRRFSPGS
jgi:alpha-tubulin suppressor-like RCC1 family protein